MADSKHTPRPWIVGHWQRSVVAPNKLGLLVAQIATGSVASTAGSSSIDEDEARANANLISAAPDLLEVVKAFVVETVDYATLNKLGDPEQQHNVKWARSVIAKAEGK